MTITQQVNKLWEDFREAIDQAYKAAGGGHSLTADVLHDYAQDMSMHDDLRELLETEIANERKHRTGRPAINGFSATTAAKVILMGNVLVGAKRMDCPPATDFLRYRKTAVEAEVLGWLTAGKLTDEWRTEVDKLDYPKLMQGGKP